MDSEKISGLVVGLGGEWGGGGLWEREGAEGRNS